MPPRRGASFRVVKNLAPSSETEGPFAGRRGSIFPPEAKTANGRLWARVVTGLVTSTPNEGLRALETRVFPRDLSRATNAAHRSG